MSQRQKFHLLGPSAWQEKVSKLRAHAVHELCKQHIALWGMVAALKMIEGKPVLQLASPSQKVSLLGHGLTATFFLCVFTSSAASVEGMLTGGVAMSLLHLAESASSSSS